MYVHLMLASCTISSKLLMSSSGSRNFHTVPWKKVLAMVVACSNRRQVVDDFQRTDVRRDGEAMNQMN
jgi:hypothetical protein